jgi:hypothetical protein
LQLGVKAGAETLALVAKTNKTAFNLNKRYQQAQATMDTYRGVTKVLAEFPPPLSFIMAGAVLTFGLAQIGKIESQQFQGLATGGRVTTGGNFVVGERGAEIVNLPRGSAVTSNADVGRSLDNNQGTYNITVNVSGDNLDRSCCDIVITNSMYTRLSLDCYHLSNNNCICFQA